MFGRRVLGERVVEVYFSPVATRGTWKGAYDSVTKTHFYLLRCPSCGIRIDVGLPFFKRESDFVMDFGGKGFPKEYEIEDGVVSPPVLCDCGFHEEVKLLR
jgi:hypothetical protein